MHVLKTRAAISMVYISIGIYAYCMDNIYPVYII